MKTLWAVALLALLTGCASDSTWHDDAGHTIICKDGRTLASAGSMGACEAAAIQAGYHQ